MDMVAVDTEADTLPQPKSSRSSTVAQVSIKLPTVAHINESYIKFFI